MVKDNNVDPRECLRFTQLGTLFSFRRSAGCRAGFPLDGGNISSVKHCPVFEAQFGSSRPFKFKSCRRHVSSVKVCGNMNLLNLDQHVQAPNQTIDKQGDVRKHTDSVNMTWGAGTCGIAIISI